MNPRDHESLARLGAILGNVGDGVIAADERGGVLLLNPSAERLTGWSSAEALGAPLEQVVRLTERPIALGGSSEDRERAVLAARDGSRRPVVATRAPLELEGGTGRVVVLRDAAGDDAGPPAPLHREEEIFRILVDQVIDYAIFMLDPGGHIVTWNRGAQRIKGYTAEEIIGRHFSVFYPAEDVAARKPERGLEVAAAVGRFEDEGWRVRRDGSCFWASVVITALHDETGALRGFAKVTRDFTDRRAAEDTARQLAVERAARAAAQASEERVRESQRREREEREQLAVILRTVQDAIWVQDRSMKLLFANDAAARSLGYSSAEEMLKAPPGSIRLRYELFDEDGAPLPLERLPTRIALDGGDPEPLMLRVRDLASGHQWWSLLKAAAIRDETGTPVQVVGLWSDVTEQRRAERVARFLAQASELLTSRIYDPAMMDELARLSVPLLADWSAVHVREGDRLVLVSVAHTDERKVEEILEMQRRFPQDPDAPYGAAAVARTGRSELLREITDDLLRSRARDAEQLALVRSLRFRSAMVVPLVARGRPIGALTLVSGESGRIFGDADLAVAEDLGRRIGSTIDSARLYREVQAAVGARDDFLSVAGHELRTPLAALVLQIDSLIHTFKREAKLDRDRLAERIEKMAARARRMELLINDLLDVSRVTAGRLDLEVDDVDLAELVGEVVERFSDALERAECSLDCSIEPVRGRWDRHRLDQVITNLLSNAIKYGKGKPIVVSLANRGDTAVLVVRDQGIGFTEADKERIFDRFERAVERHRFAGMGLGLWITREIVLAHGGTIRAEGEPDRGARFTVDLPLKPRGGG